MTYGELDAARQPGRARAARPRRRRGRPGRLPRPEQPGVLRGDDRRRQDRRRDRAAELPAHPGRDGPHRARRAARPCWSSGPAFEAAVPAIRGRGAGALPRRAHRRGLRVLARRRRAPRTRAASRRTTTWCCSSTPPARPGCPRACMLTNGNCSGLMDVANAWDVDETSVSLVAMPLFHIGGSGWANVALARGGTDVLVPMIDPAGAARHDRAGPDHQRVPGAGGAADDVRGAGRRRPRLLQPALDRVRRLADHDGGPEAVPGGLPGAAVPGLRPDRDDRRDHRARRSTDHDPGGPRQHLLRSAGRPYPWVEMKAVDPVTGEDCAARRGRRDLDPVAAELPRLLEQARRHRRGVRRGRLAAHRRRRLPRRRGLRVPHRPDQGHDRDRRRERLPDRGRVRALRAPRRRRRRGDRGPRREAGARPSRRSSSAGPGRRSPRTS